MSEENQHFKVEKNKISKSDKVKIDVGVNVVECEIIEIMYKIIHKRRKLSNGGIA